MNKQKFNAVRFAPSKTMLLFLLFITGMGVVVSYHVHVIICSMLLVTFVILFSTFIERSRIERFLDSRFNKR